MSNFDDVSNSINAAATALAAASGQLQSIVSTNPAGSQNVTEAQAAQASLTAASTALANAQGDLASAIAGAQAGQQAATEAAKQPAVAITAPTAPPSSVSVGAAVTMVLGAAVAGGISGWALKSYAGKPSLAAKPNPLRRRL